MARIQQPFSSTGGGCNSTRLIAFDANLMRQQGLVPASVQAPIDGSQSSAYLEGDVILQAEMNSCSNGKVVFALEASEALDLAKQLIASASGHLRRAGEC